MTGSGGRSAERLAEHAADWRVLIDAAFETPSSFIAYGTRENAPVVLKVVKDPRDEWNAGQILRAFDGRGTVRMLSFLPGAMLLERLQPGHSLVELCARGRDAEATRILAAVLEAIPPDTTLPSCPTVADWGIGFVRYAEGAHRPLPGELVARAQEAYKRLASSQVRRVLLHGDLQHSNVLFDRHRGWVAIDPKGVIGEREFEIGAILRNPYDRPALYARRPVIERRVEHFVARLPIDRDRTVAWAFAQSVLAAIWAIEDGFAHPQVWEGPLRLAQTLAPLVR